MEFSYSIHRSIVIHLLDNDDERVVIFWIAKRLNQKAQKFDQIGNKHQTDSDDNFEKGVTDYQITSK